MNSLRIALIGFGEVGTTFARGFMSLGGYEVSAYDILMRDPVGRSTMVEKARSLGVRMCQSALEAVESATVVISAVTAACAYDVAKEASSHLQAGQFFLDINSVSPATKRRDAEALSGSGAAYVEAAVMAPVAPYGLKVPIVLGGKHAAELHALLGSAMQLEIGEPEVGKASALKMCRSIMIKGLEALAVECFAAARLYEVEEKVLASLAESYPGINWETLAGYNIGRTVQHGRRRAAEMREAAETIAETGLTPLMASATAERIDWVADQVEANPKLKSNNDGEWRATLDAMALDAGLRQPREP
jgi:3-hydroxyisobutyrate dehydrogenase-like beta-hydroxyacid dehydrogenase